MKTPSNLLKVVLAAVSVGAGSLYVSAQLAPAKTHESKRPTTKLASDNPANPQPDQSDERYTTSAATTTDRTGNNTARSDSRARDLGTVNVNVASNRDATAGMRAGEIDRGEVVIPLHREAVNVDKRIVDEGAVRLRKVVRTESVNEPVELRREMVVIERVDRNGQNRPTEATNGIPGTFEEGEIVIPLSREEPIVNKQVLVSDQVVARTDIETDRQNVRENVRTETVEFIDRGDPNRVRVIGDVAEANSRDENKKKLLADTPSQEVVRHSPKRP